jgi:hypothetical protein
VSRRSAIAVAIAGVLLAGGLPLLLTDLARRDFIAFYAAARLVALGQGQAIVDPIAILASERAADPARVALLPWVHPPAVALVLAPLGLLPFAAAAVVMVALDVICLVWALRRLSSMFPNIDRPILFATALVAPPALLSLTHGQTTPELLALVVAAMTAGSPFRGGLALGLTMIRPQTALLFALAGMSSRRGALGVVAGWGIIGAASLVVVGPAGLVTYVGQLLHAASWTTRGEYGTWISVSWTSVTLALGWPEVAFVLAVVSLLAGAAAVAIARGRARIIAASAWCLIGTVHAGVVDVLVIYPAVADRASRSSAAAIIIVATGYVAMVLQLMGVPLAPFWILGLAVALTLGRRRPGDR